MTGNDENQTLTQALAYAAAGWPVLPCKPEAKTPATAHGFGDATTDPAVIRSWWMVDPRRNVAIATGAPGPDVLDVDVREDGNGFGALNRLKRAGLLEGAMALIRTRSGGLHVYFTGTQQGCHSLPRHHLDFKAAGGYVLAPPSVVGGSPYELLRHTRGQAVLDWAKVTALLEPPRPHRSREVRPLAPGEVPPLVRWALEAPAPDRSAALHRLVGACVDAGLDDDTIHEVAGGYEPGISKYGRRLHTEIDRSLSRVG